MWQDNKAIIIDWEAAGYVNPYQEFIEVVNYWATEENGLLNQDKVQSLLCSYSKKISIKNVDWTSVFNSGYEGMLGWLEYNLKRGLGLEIADESERDIGNVQIKSTISELYHYEEKSKVLKKWLMEN